MFAPIHLWIISQPHRNQPYLSRFDLGGSELKIQYVPDRATFVKYLRENPPDLILSPRVTDAINPQEVLDILHQYNQDIPVIVLGEAEDDERQIVPLIKAGAADYVTMAQIGRLWDAVENTLEAARSQMHPSHPEQHKIPVPAEQTLEDTHTLLKAVMENAPVILFTMNPDGIIITAQGKLLNTLHISSQRIIGTSIFDVLQQYPMAVEDYAKILRGELRHSVHHFSRLILETFYKPLTDADGKISSIVAVTVDITEREHAQKLLLDAERMRLELAHEREVMAMREGFISMITHEFRQPITTILGSSDILTLYEERLDSTARNRHLAKIGSQARYMMELLEDVLMISTARSGKLELELESFNLFDLCIDVIEQLGLGTENSKHHFVLGIGSDLNGVVLDYRLTRHIVSNLLTNAVKYTPEGGTIALEAQFKEDHVHLLIQDTGIGIPEPDQRHLFEPFFRARNRGKARGTGLGLALVRYSVEALGGSIQLESVEGEGSTFVVRLPKMIDPVTM